MRLFSYLALVIKIIALPVLWTICLLCLITIGGWIYQTAQEERGPRYDRPGEMVFALGEWVHVQCYGRRTNPVLFLEAGAMGWSDVWSWFFVHGSERYYVCSWDRPGLGRSQPTHRSGDAESTARLLHEVLTAQGLNQRPLVLVGHSLGGLHVLNYQRLFPQDVRALVLIDPAHPQQLQRLPRDVVQKTFTQVETLTSHLPLLDFGVARGVLGLRRESTLYLLPEEHHSRIISISSSRRHLQRAIVEYEAWDISVRDTMRIQHLGQLPLLVMSASDREHGNRQANHIWWEMHQEMSRLSLLGNWIVIPQSSHQSIIMNEPSALMVLEQIDRLQAIDTSLANSLR